MKDHVLGELAKTYYAAIERTEDTHNTRGHFRRSVLRQQDIIRTCQVSGTPQKLLDGKRFVFLYAEKSLCSLIDLAEITDTVLVRPHQWLLHFPPTLGP